MTNQASIKFSDKKPPMYDVCEKYFGADWDSGTIFAYGDTIHAKHISFVTPDVYAHEAVHMRQQEIYGDKDRWWDRYLRDQAFRCNQEVEAYKGQLQYALEKYTRNHRRALKKHVYASLSGLSGGTISITEAEKLLS